MHKLPLEAAIRVASDGKGRLGIMGNSEGEMPTQKIRLHIFPTSQTGLGKYDLIRRQEWGCSMTRDVMRTELLSRTHPHYKNEYINQSD